MRINLGLLFVFMCGSCLVIACDDDTSTKVEVMAGEMTAGEMTAGEMTAGEMTAGEMTAGEITAGEMTAGEMTAGEMTAGEQAEDIEVTTQRAFEWLIGTFDSSAQSVAQPSYYAVQLTSCEMPAPTIGARAMYLEQAIMDNLAAPYRQRLYVVEPAGMSEEGRPLVTSSIFEFVDKDSLVGLCNRDEERTFVNADVIFKAGCEVYLEWMGDHFEGGTRGEGCLSNLNGATYATSEVYLAEELLTSWDRGFDSMGEQVWGAVDGAYEFVRK